MFGFNQRQIDIWNNLKSTNHPIWQDVNRRADLVGQYEDIGQYDCLIYLITGNASYAVRAWEHTKSIFINSDPDRNTTRHFFGKISKMYGQIKSGLNAQQRADFISILDKWVVLIHNSSHGTRFDDSDELTGHYFGAAVYASVLYDENPTKSKQISDAIGGFVKTGDNWDTMRNVLANYANLFKGGVWIESSAYNWETVGYILDGISCIGIDNFPEYKSELQNLAKSVVNAMANDLSDLFQWGDEQDPHYVKIYNALGTMAKIAFMSDNANAYLLFDKFYTKNGLTNIPGDWVFYVDHLKPRAMPSGRMSQNANGMGFAFCHDGWTQNDYTFYSQMKSRTFVDHDSHGFSNFNFYKGNIPVITNPRGYYANPDTEAEYLNTLLVHGALPLVEQEYKKQIDFKDGGDYFYHAGTAKGKAVRDKFYDPPETVLKEWTRQIVHHKGVIVIFDRVNSQNPVNLPKFARYDTFPKSLMTNAGGCHIFLLQLPVAPIKAGNVYTWISGGQNIKLTAFFDHSYSTNASQHGGYFLNPDTERKQEIRLKTLSGDGFQTLLTIINTSGANTSRITQSGKDGVIIDGKSFVFNALVSDVPGLTVNGSVPPPPPVTYLLSITGSANGIVTKSPNKSIFNPGEIVSLTAIPNSGYKFDGWTGGIISQDNPLSLTMDTNRLLTPNYSPITSPSQAINIKLNLKVNPSANNKEFTIELN